MPPHSFGVSVPAFDAPQLDVAPTASGKPHVEVTAHYGEAGGTPSLALIHGNVVSKNPDREFRGKMWRLAQALNAKVQGDDGEFYDCFGNPTPRAWTTQSYWLALLRHLGFKFIWGDPVGS